MDKKNKFSSILIDIVLVFLAFITLMPVLSAVFGSFKTNMEIMLKMHQMKE